MQKNAKISITLQEFDFLRHFADLESISFGNAYKSALRAGYSLQYARVIRRNYPLFRRKWLKMALKDDGLVRMIEATRYLDFGVPIKTHEEIKRIIHKRERDLVGMSAEEVTRGLDQLLGKSI